MPVLKYENMNEKILEKIKNLLRMKRGGTPAEIETALALARELAAKHDIDIDSVDPEEKLKSELGHKDAYVARRVPYDQRYAAKICELYFNVDVVYRHHARLVDGWPMTGYAICFIGRGFEIEIAIYIFQFLCGHFARTWRTGRGRCRSRQSFIWGMFCGIRAKLEEQQAPPASSALVLSRRTYVEKLFPKLRETNSGAPDIADTAAMAGYIAGRNTELRKGVKETQTYAKLIKGAGGLD
jgi:hypothetical protein